MLRSKRFRRKPFDGCMDASVSTIADGSERYGMEPFSNGLNYDGCVIYDGAVKNDVVKERCHRGQCCTLS